jgi:hypothetical protein
MRDTFQVSSVISTAEMSISHRKTFLSFPSLCSNNLLPTCFASSLFKELMVLKQKVQCILNTRSMNGKCSQISHVKNINYLTWLYIIRDLPCELVCRNIVVKRYYIADDEAVLQKTRATQQSFELTLPQHLIFAQRLFGSAAGIGTRTSLSCRLKKKQLSAVAEDRHQIRFFDELNVVPFENPDGRNEYVRRGIIMQYVPSEQELTVIVRFRKMKGNVSLEPQFRARRMAGYHEDHAIDNDDEYPFHSNISLFGCFISTVNLNDRTVLLSNNTVVTIEESIAEFNRIMT